MADNKNSAHTLVCESQEALYERAVKKMQADRLIVQYAFKIENYLTAAAMFEEVGNYLDAEVLADKCRKLAEQTRKEQKNSQYQKALEVKEHAESDSDYEKLIAVFQELGDYENAPQELETCKKQKMRYEKRIKRKEVLLVSALVLCIGLIAGGASTGFFHYLMGVCYDSMGYYEKAEELFESLELLDSKERALSCQEKLLKEQEMEALKTLKKAKAGDSVIFAGNQWKVLERQEDQLFLILKEIDKTSIFYQVAYQEEKEASDWENSSLKRWLEEEALPFLFEEEEIKVLVAMDGEKLTILSAEEAKRWEEQLTSLTDRDYWLKDYDAETGRAAFVSAAGVIMDGGYSEDAQMSVRPVITVDCTKLTEEEEA